MNENLSASANWVIVGFPSRTMIQNKSTQKWFNDQRIKLLTWLTRRDQKRGSRSLETFSHIQVDETEHIKSSTCHSPSTTSPHLHCKHRAENHVSHLQTPSSSYYWLLYTVVSSLCRHTLMATHGFYEFSHLNKHGLDM